MATMKVFCNAPLASARYIYASRGRLADRCSAKNIRCYSINITPDVSATARKSGFDQPIEVEIAIAMMRDGQPVFSPMFLKSDGRQGIYEFLNDYEDYVSCSVHTYGFYAGSLPRPSFPMKVNIQRTRDGRHCVHIQTNPNHFGLKEPGKLFFPDSSWTDVIAGPATVQLKFEDKSFGFLYGAMDKWESPSINEFLDWLWNNGVDDNRYVRVLDSPVGDFIYDVDDNIAFVVEAPTATEESTEEENTSKAEEGEDDKEAEALVTEATQENPIEESTEAEQGSPAEATFAVEEKPQMKQIKGVLVAEELEPYYDGEPATRISILFNDIYNGEYSYEEFCHALKSTEFAVRVTERMPVSTSILRNSTERLLDVTGELGVPKGASDTMRFLIEEGAVTCTNLVGYNAYILRLSQSNKSAFLQLSLDDLEKWVSEYNSSVEEQDTRIKGYLQKGTLRLVCNV